MVSVLIVEWRGDRMMLVVRKCRKKTYNLGYMRDDSFNKNSAAMEIEMLAEEHLWSVC